MGDLNLPFEPQEPTPFHDHESSLIASGVVVLAATVPVEGEKWPALIFRFANPDGSGFYPPMALACNDHDMALLRPLIVEAIQAARRAAQLA